MSAPATPVAKRVAIRGVVQGVGFRPFVHGLAARHGVGGWVANTSSGVDLAVEGAPEAVARFLADLEGRAPPLARIHSVVARDALPGGLREFVIRDSAAQPDGFQPVSPDVALCDDCRRELLDPADRRHRHPFVNCTNCGPRFTVVRDVPWDRPNTTMAAFPMCAQCAAEYADPRDRRFHAQPIACPACGPRVELVSPAGPLAAGDDAIRAARRLLAAGAIVAVKGLGGFHLACDAAREDAVAELRRRKGRVGKPFALMAADLAAAERLAEVSPEERGLLLARERPIVLLRRRAGAAVAPVAPSVAPGQATLGVMLPYAPLHELLFAPAPGEDPPPVFDALVMTSGNRAEEPIARANDEALARLAPLADAFLLHDREIAIRCDDSVARVFDGRELPLRRSRGYAPYPVRLPFEAPPLFAVGAEVKNTFCVTRGPYAFLSQHVGDLENAETLAALAEGVAAFERLFRIRPAAVAHDLHPDAFSTRWALERAVRDGLSAYAVQHHHAHVAACLAEHAYPPDRPVIGVAFDGAGHGADGAVWGGEFLAADLRSFERVAHLAYVPLPGGDAAVRRPWRMALAWLAAAGVEWTEDLPPVAAAGVAGRAAVAAQLRSGANSPPTSSMGRLFDAVASLAGVRQEVTYEGQAAMELEALADPRDCGAYPVSVAGPGPIDVRPLVRAVAADVRAGVPAPVVSARFHSGVAHLVRDACVAIRAASGLGDVALSGGVFQNVTLLSRVLALLHAERFRVLVHRLVPPNDGGLALGQAAVAAWLAARGGGA